MQFMQKASLLVLSVICGVVSTSFFPDTFGLEINSMNVLNVNWQILEYGVLSIQDF